MPTEIPTEMKNAIFFEEKENIKIENNMLKMSVTNNNETETLIFSSSDILELCEKRVLSVIFGKRGAKKAKQRKTP